MRSRNKIRMFNETMVIASMREGDKTPDGSGVHKIQKTERNYQLTQRLATFIDTVTNELEEYTKIVHRLAITDALTGLNNRREIEGIIESIAKKNKSFSLIMLDADNFKQINDTFGHKEGDKALCILSDAIRSVEKESGVEVHSGRWGGDEFLLVCVSEDEKDAIKIAEGLQNKYHLKNAYPEFDRTVSIGIASSKEGMESEAVFQEADTSLYSAKAKGKGLIEIGK